jgi:hypothetical protein
MIFYVAHCFGGDPKNLERAKQITHDLQIKDTENTYICPLLTFSHLRYGELSYETEIEICKDILSVCDKLIVASELSKGVQIEVDFANLVGMEIEWLEEENEEPNS